MAMPMTVRMLAALALALTTGATFPSTASADPTFGATAAAIVDRDPATGLVRALANPAGTPVALGGPGAAGASREAAALSFLRANRLGFGLQAATAGLSATRTLDAGRGRAVVRVQPTHKGLPILGAALNVQLDAANNVLSVNGKTVGGLDVDVAPELTAADAVRTAIDLTARTHGVSTLRLKATDPTLAIHDPRVFGGPPQPPHAVWFVEVTSPERTDFSEVVLVDVKTGRVSVAFDNRPYAVPARAKQVVCDAENSSIGYPCDASAGVKNPAKSTVKDVRNAYAFAEDTYDFYARRFGRNSLDNKGLPLKSTVRWVPRGCGQDCPDGKFENAFWDNTQMVYGTDFANADDVVGHELSHGFTLFTSGLFYYFQSGAINEALSDIFGEYIDQSNGVDGIGGPVKWLLAEDLPIGVIRSMSNPPQFGDPDRMRSKLYTADPNLRDGGGVHTNSGVANKAAYLMTEKSPKVFNGQTITGIGIDKAAAVWYRVNTLYLNSGSDYADLGLALNQACTDLVGVTPKTQAGAASPDGAITTVDCGAVRQAVLATEMAKPPLVHPIPAEAPVCITGTPTNLVYDRFEAPTSSFEPVDNLFWVKIDTYAASNAHSWFAGDSWSAGKTFDTNLHQIASVTIPQKAFLRFAHFYNLTAGASGAEAGGIVEYLVDGARSWKQVPRSLFTHNPYNLTVVDAVGKGNVLKGKRAFSGFSGGWTSSRIDLSSLAGKKVKFRFRLATNSEGAGMGWGIDDIRLFTCS